MTGLIEGLQAAAQNLANGTIVAGGARAAFEDCQKHLGCKTALQTAKDEIYQTDLQLVKIAENPELLAAFTREGYLTMCANNERFDTLGPSAL